MKKERNSVMTRQNLKLNQDSPHNCKIESNNLISFLNLNNQNNIQILIDKNLSNDINQDNNTNIILCNKINENINLDKGNNLNNDNCLSNKISKERDYIYTLPKTEPNEDIKEQSIPNQIILKVISLDHSNKISDKNSLASKHNGIFKDPIKQQADSKKNEKKIVSGVIKKKIKDKDNKINHPHQTGYYVDLFYF